MIDLSSRPAHPVIIKPALEAEMFLKAKYKGLENQLSQKPEADERRAWILVRVWMFDTPIQQVGDKKAGSVAGTES